MVRGSLDRNTMQFDDQAVTTTILGAKGWGSKTWTGTLLQEGRGCPDNLGVVTSCNSDCDSTLPHVTTLAGGAGEEEGVKEKLISGGRWLLQVARAMADSPSATSSIYTELLAKFRGTFKATGNRLTNSNEKICSFPYFVCHSFLQDTLHRGSSLLPTPPIAAAGVLSLLLLLGSGNHVRREGKRRDGRVWVGRNMGGWEGEGSGHVGGEKI